jgi:phosphoserine aminotransferase
MGQVGRRPLEGLKARCTANAHALDKIGELFVARPPRGRQRHPLASVCLTVEGLTQTSSRSLPASRKRKAQPLTSPAIAMPGRPAHPGAAPRSIPDIEALGPWLDWAYAQLTATAEA